MVSEDERATLEAVIEKAQASIHHHAHVPRERVLLRDYRSVFWRDSAMGLHPQPGERVERKNRPGYMLLFETPVGYYRIHADATTRAIKLDTHWS